MTLPTFLVVGSMKCGTSTLRQMLARHPRIATTERKELHFFDRNWHRGVEWYAEQFAMGPGQEHCFEATPINMWHPKVRRRMISTLPDLQCVVILRDPVARAYSHFWHSRGRGVEESESFEEALALEEERLASDATIRELAAWSYVSRGRYFHQLRALEAAYGRDRLHVILLDDLVRDPRAVMAGAFEFLEVDPEAMPSYDLPHANQRKSLVPPMREETRDQLRRTFRAPDRALAEWLGRSLPWRQPSAQVKA